MPGAESYGLSDRARPSAQLCGVFGRNEQPLPERRESGLELIESRCSVKAEQPMDIGRRDAKPTRKFDLADARILPQPVESQFGVVDRREPDLPNLGALGEARSRDGFGLLYAIGDSHSQRVFRHSHGLIQGIALGYCFREVRKGDDEAALWIVIVEVSRVVHGVLFFSFLKFGMVEVESGENAAQGLLLDLVVPVARKLRAALAKEYPHMVGPFDKGATL